MQELDTYGCLRRYAQHPSDPAAILGFRLLRRRTEVHNAWEYVKSNAKLSIEDVLNFSIGATKDKIKPDGAYGDLNAAFVEMSDEERMDLYKKMCKDAGISLNFKDLGVENS